MPILHQAPPVLGLSKVDNYLILKASNEDPADYAVTVKFRLGTNDPGTFLTLVWNGKKVKYEFRLLPDEDDELPTETYQTEEEYYQQLIDDYFKKNLLLASDWLMTIEEIVSEPFIVFRYRFKEDLIPEMPDLENSAANARIISTPTFSLPEYSPVIAVVIDRPDGNEDYLITQVADYDLYTFETPFNVSQAFDLRPHLPSAFLPLGYYVFGLATKAYQKYWIRYADRNNTDGSVSLTTKAGPYYMLNGGAPSTSAKTFGIALASPIVCHNYNPTYGSQVPKVVGIEQPDWLYLWTDTNLVDVYVSVKLYFNDYTTAVYNPSHMAPFTLQANNLYWLQSGFRQMRIHEAVVPEGKEIVAYDWELRSAEGDLLRSVKFEVDCDCHPWELYLLFDTGLGGCETIRLKGKTTEGFKVNRETFRTSRPMNYDFAEGEEGYYNQEGVQVYEVATGFYKARYIQHIRQLLLAEAWLLDMQRNKFIKIQIDTSSITDIVQDQDLFAFEFAFKVAGYDSAYHNF